jgi:hypothetical protein
MLLWDEQTQKCTYQSTGVTNSKLPDKFTHFDVTVPTMDNTYTNHTVSAIPTIHDIKNLNLLTKHTSHNFYAHK